MSINNTTTPQPESIDNTSNQQPASNTAVSAKERVKEVIAPALTTLAEKFSFTPSTNNLKNFHIQLENSTNTVPSADQPMAVVERKVDLASHPILSHLSDDEMKILSDPNALKEYCDHIDLIPPAVWNLIEGLVEHGVITAEQFARVLVHPKHCLSPEVCQEKLTALLQKELLLDRPNPSLCRWLLTKGANLELIEKNEGRNPDQLIVINWLQSFTTKTELSQESLNHLALRQGMGYKSANLVISELMISSINEQLQHSQVKIPPSIPLCDVEITFHLKQHAPEVFKLWQQFLEAFDPEQKNCF